ncbi:MAG: sn-glycerol-3-phosphate ABC transporter ATP-binding protein UgpC [Rhodobacteraceae bacterium]|nr:sn-glycerol-3-phosphate ABC transporter ATP-binding protein UgpC [Paracoccaceae bacterium]
MARIELLDIAKFYGHVCAVHGVNLSIEDGEFVALVGPSGCGKSTILRMIAGLEEISEGTLRIGSMVMNDIEPKSRDIAMVFQDYALYPHMTVRENIAFGLKMRGVSTQDIDKRIADVAEILKVSAYLNRKPGQLSGGQRQRVAMGRAIVREPKAFLFDEPLSNLDAKLRVEMRTQIKRMHRMLQATMVYVTHDQTEAMTLADRVVVLSSGAILQQGPPIHVYTFPNCRFVGEFIGSPQMNILTGVFDRSGCETIVRLDGATLSLGRLDVPFGAKVDVGIRPEDLKQSSKENSKIDAVIDLLEPLGSDTLAICRFNQNEITVRLAPETVLSQKGVISLDFDLGKLHYFDHHSGKRLNVSGCGS